jgi:hypothetical protein
VRRVTGAADGKFFISLSESAAVNAFCELFINAVVTVSAGSSHILDVDGGQWVTGRQLTVTRMAIHAGGRYQKTTLQKALAMNAHRVVLDDLSLIARIRNSGFLAFAVASPTQFRDVSCKCGRRFIAF